MGFLDPKLKKWPAYFTLKFLIRELDDFYSAEKVMPEDGISLFKFSFEKKKEIYVAWLEDEKPRGIDDFLLTKKVTFKGIQAKKAIEIPMDEFEAKNRNFQNTSQGCELVISSTPIFIFPGD